MPRDPYEVLGVAKGADIKDVKAAYRRLARDLHPDLHPGDTTAEDRFKDVAAAYDFLNDADQKGRYDRGEIDASGAPTAQRTFYRSYAEGEPGTRYHDPREMFEDLGDMGIFADMFGGRSGARGGRTASFRGGDVRARMDISLREAVKGGSRDLLIGEGKHLRVTIPAGAHDGQVLRLKGQGMPGLGGGESGDVLIELELRDGDGFHRDGDDILSEVPVTLPEAVLGARIQAPTVDGPVTLTVPKGSNTGSKLRLRGKGLPKAGGGRGDHYVTLQVVLPQHPDADLVKLVEQWGEKHPYTVRTERSS